MWLIQVGSLVIDAEGEAARIATAGKVTDEAKAAMQAALEQSSQIVDYNTHAAQVSCPLVFSMVILSIVLLVLSIFNRIHGLNI